nr:hypothetical protein [Tanacetum cinerariifolium]GEZ11649.1 hypothetical protein [Tanacetum cinerariifolium]
NTNVNAAFDEKEPEFEGRKPESKVNVSPSSSAQSKKHDDKTKREAKGKSPDESLTGYRNLSKEFEYFSDNSINEDNATDTSQLPDDPNMPELEDITYSNDENDVGVEADFNNLETSIIVSPISTIRVHEDHHVTQIIGDLSSATQTRSMTRVARDQEPKRVHQALKDPSWIEAMQEKLLQFKMHKVWVLVDSPHGKRAIGFEDPDYPDKVYKVVKEIYGLHQAPRACQDKYIAEILRKFGLTDGKSASTPIDTEKPLPKDPDGDDKSVAVKKVNDVTRLQALVDKKKVIITEASIRDALRLDDAEGVECLPNEEFFTELARMGYEKPSTKLTFYKAFFSS